MEHFLISHEEQIFCNHGTGEIPQTFGERCFLFWIFISANLIGVMLALLNPQDGENI